MTGVCIGPWILSRPPSALCAVVDMPTFLRSDLVLNLDAHGLLFCHALDCEPFSGRTAECQGSCLQVCEQLHFFLQKAFPKEYSEREKETKGSLTLLAATLVC